LGQPLLPDQMDGHHHVEIHLGPQLLRDGDGGGEDVQVFYFASFSKRRCASFSERTDVQVFCCNEFGNVKG